MLQAIEQRIDEGLLLEQLVPRGEVQVGRDDRRNAVIPLVHEAEEGVALFRLEGQISELIDEQRLERAQVLEELWRGAIGERGVEFIEQNLGVVEAAVVTVLKEPGFVPKTMFPALVK